MSCALEGSTVVGLATFVAAPLSLTPGRVERVGPVEPGAHNEEIYCRLGIGRDNLAALRAKGVV